MKKIIVVLVVVALLVASFFIGKKTGKPSDTATDNSITTVATNDTTVTTSSTDIMTEEELSAKVSEEVDRQIAEKFAEVTANTSVAETTVSTTQTANQEVAETSSNITKAEAPFGATCHHNSEEYEMVVASNEYEAAFRSIFLPEGRDFSVELNTDVINISVANSFVGEDDIMSDFGEFSNVEFSNENGVISFSYSIPDNPNGSNYEYYIHTNFSAVFRIETNSGVYYTAITY